MVLRELCPERRLPGGARVRVQLRDGGVGRNRQHRGPLAHHAARAESLCDTQRGSASNAR